MAKHDRGVGVQWEASSESNFRAGPSLFAVMINFQTLKLTRPRYVVTEGLSVDSLSQFDVCFVQMRLAGTTEPTTPSMQPSARLSRSISDHRRGRKIAIMSSRFVSQAHAIACPWTLCFNEKGTFRAVGPPQELHVCPSPSKMVESQALHCTAGRIPTRALH